MAQRHVTPAPPGGWQVVDPDSDRVCVITATKDDAVHCARRALGRSGGGTLVVEMDDGSGQQLAETVQPASQPPRTSFVPAASAPDAGTPHELPPMTRDAPGGETGQSSGQGPA